MIKAPQITCEASKFRDDITAQSVAIDGMLQRPRRTQKAKVDGHESAQSAHECDLGALAGQIMNFEHEKSAVFAGFDPSLRPRTTRDWAAHPLLKMGSVEVHLHHFDKPSDQDHNRLVA